MAVNLNVNGINYAYPETGDTNWGQSTTQWAQAVTNGTLQKAGGSFPLTANVDFGANFGLISSYYTSRSSNTATTGSIRLAQADQISFRNVTNTADLPITVNLSNELTFNGSKLLTSSSGIVNSEIASNAAIAFSKMAALTASRALVSDGSGVVTTSSVTSTELGYVSGVTSAVQTQIDAKLNLAGGTLTGSLVLANNPTLTLEAATKQYVDNAMLGISPKPQGFVATTTAGTLASDFEAGDTVDGEVLTAGDIILIKDQVSSEENGIYIVQATGAPVRSTDADTWTKLLQAYIFITNGTQNGGTAWLSNATPGGTINTTPVLFNQFSGSTQYTADGQGIELTGTLFSLELDGSTLTKSASGLRLASGLESSINAALPNPLTTTGDLIYSSSGTTGARLGIGSTGQILTVSGGLPSWQSFSLNPVVVASSTGATLTAADSNKIYLVDTSSARSFQLPSPAAGLIYTIKDATGQAATNNISILRAGSEQIEGIAATKLLQTNWGCFKIVSDGTNWFIVH
jgi:hypothetical protein